jgi:hypothetical protein
MAKQKRPATAKRKRAKGAGRPPKGPFADLTRPFSIRMPAWLHERLEAAGKRNDRSIGQELLRRVKYTLDRDLDRAPPPAMRALCFVIARVGKDANFYPDYTAEDGWRTDPHNFKVFEHAVTRLLASLAPRGDTRPGFRPCASPEEEGDSIAEAVWRDLHYPPDPIVRDVPDEVFEAMPYPQASDPHFRKKVREEFAKPDYGIKDAAHALLGAYATIMKEPGVERAPPSEPGQSDSAPLEPPPGGLLATFGQPSRQ